MCLGRNTVNSEQRERHALHLGRGRLAKGGGKQCYKQAGNQRDLVSPREPGSLACNLTAFAAQAAKQAARETHSEAGTHAETGWQKQGRRLIGTG
jgi:hypothetical protein